MIHPGRFADILGAPQTDRKGVRLQTCFAAASRRYAEIQERLIAPDGTFPSIGRSTCYRFGAFQTLAQMSLMDELPEGVKPGQVVVPSRPVIRRMIEFAGDF